jgi:replicative DNA helicase
MKQDFIDKIQDIIGNQNTDERKLLFQLQEAIIDAELQYTTVSDSKSIADLVSANLTHLKEGSPQSTLIKTGFTEFDKLFGGFSLGELVVIGGRPAMGKTQLLVNLSLYISQTIPVLYFTFDLSEYSLTSRFISTMSGITANKILLHELTNEEKDTLLSIGNTFSTRKILVNDSCSNSLSAFRAHCQRQIEEHGVKVIVIDYLQLMSANKHRHSREHEISHISRELKNIAKDLNICVIAASQLSRAVEFRGGSRHPQLSDLRESGAIEQDADKVIFVYRPEYYGVDCDEEGNDTAGLTELLIAKNRNGSLGQIKLMRDANFTSYRDFDGYKSAFSFSKSRLDEIDNPFLNQ